jgi:transposase
MLRTAQEARLDKVRQVMPLQGLGSNGAWVGGRAFLGWRALPNRREVGGGAGLTPTPYQSGARACAQCLTKAGPRHGRWMPTELAWSWGRSQPARALRGGWRERCGGGGQRLRRLGLVAVARQ